MGREAWCVGVDGLGAVYKYKVLGGRRRLCIALMVLCGLGEGGMVIKKEICQRWAWLGIAITTGSLIRNAALLAPVPFASVSPVLRAHISQVVSSRMTTTH